MRLILSSLLVLLFGFGYVICNLFYPEYLLNKGEHADKWWDLRMNLYSVLIGGLFYTLTLKQSYPKLERFVLEIGVGLSMSDIIDRLVFDVTKFTNSDYFMIFATLVFATIDFNRDKLIKYLPNWLCRTNK